MRSLPHHYCLSPPSQDTFARMFSTKLKKPILFLCLAFSLNALPAIGEETSSLTIRGFGTLGVARSSSADAEFIRDLSQPNGIKDGEWSGRIDSVLGIQANWQLNPEWEVVAQAVSRYQYDGSRGPQLDLAFLKWVPNDRLSLRAGHISSDLMMLADSRLIGYSYLTVRPSIDFFSTLFFSSFDGVDGTYTAPLGKGLIRSKIFIGTVQEKAIGAPGVWDTSDSGLSGFVADYFVGQWQFRASATDIRFSNNLNFNALTQPLYAIAGLTGITTASVAADALTAKDTNTRYYTLGTVYDNGPLQIQAALNAIDHETATFQNSVAGYVLGSYRMNTITPFAGISRAKSTYKDYAPGLPDTPLFAPLNQAYQTLMNASGTNQTTYTLGARWDARPNIAFKLQGDAVRGGSDSQFPYASANTDPNWNGQTNVISITMDFIF